MMTNTVIITPAFRLCIDRADRLYDQLSGLVLHFDEVYWSDHKTHVITTDPPNAPRHEAAFHRAIKTREHAKSLHQISLPRQVGNQSALHSFFGANAYRYSCR